MALRGISGGETVAALGDLASFSSSSTLMVSTPELTAAVFAGAAGPTLLLFFLAFAVWVVAIVAIAWDADILPAVCRVCRGADMETFGGALLAVGASSPLPPTNCRCTPRCITAESPARLPHHRP
jgi:hypothetical protein